MPEIFPPKNFTDVVLCLVFIAIALDYAMKLLDRFRSKPANESLNQSQKDLERRIENLEHATKEISTKLEADVQRVLLSGAQRGARIHERIDPLIENTAHIKGQMEGLMTSIDAFAAMAKQSQHGKHHS